MTLDPYWEDGEDASWQHDPSDTVPSTSTRRGAHAAPGRASSGRRRRAPLAIATGVLCMALGLGFAAGRGGDVTQGTALTPGQNISDNLQRTDLTGLGNAPVGGRWLTYPKATMAVTLAGATIAVKPGESARAILQGVTAANEVVRTVFTVPAAATKGNGTYFGLDLRRQTGGQSYRAQLNLRPGGKMVLRLVKRVKGGTSVLGKQVTFATPRPGTKIAFEAAVTGTATTLLQARWWNAAVARPGWQARATDSSPGVLRSAGRYGIVVYQSGLSGSASVRVHSIEGWVAKPGGVSSAPSTTSSAPSTTARPPTTTAAPPTKSQSSTTTTTSPPPPNNQSHPPVAGGSGGTVGNSNPSSRGSLAPGKTSYAVPGNAVFVSASGSASGDGSKAKPVSTVTRGIQLAKSGATIVIRGGTYHESVSVPLNKRLTIQSYPGEAVWFDGSSPVTTWARSGNGWVHSGWTARFDHTPGWNAGAAKGEPWVNARNRMAAYPDQLWIDGAAQTQVGSLSQLTAGTFYVDTANKRLYVGSNPGGRSVRASDLQIAVWISSNNSVLRGVGVRRYATPITQKGSVRLRGDGDSVQNVLVLDSATVGFDLTANNLKVDHVTIQNAGLLGIHAEMSDNLVLSNSLITGSNSQRFNYKPVAGGIKCGNCRNVRIVGNTISGSHDSTGVWFDVSSMNITVAGNTVSGNGMRGIMTEISQSAILVNNVVTNNSQAGIYVLDTGGVKIWNNTLNGNGLRDIALVQDSRTPANYRSGWDKHIGKANPSIPWITRNIQISNNLIQSTSTQYMVTVYDSTQKHGAPGMATTIDGNLFSRPSASRHYEIGWSYAHKGMPGFATPAAFTKATGQGHNNRDYAAGTTSAASAAAHAAPLGLPSDVAAAAGRSAGTRHVGVF